MTYAVVGLALLAAATVVNALLTYSVVKSWRAVITAPAPASAPAHEDHGPPPLAVDEGDRPPAFTLHTPGGDVTEAALAGHPALICFLRPNCGPTRDSLADIERWAAANTPSGAHVVAVIGGEGTAAEPLLAAVGPRTELIVTEPPQGPLATVFGVRHHPTFVLLDADGTVTETGIGTGSLPAFDLLAV